MRFAVFPDEFRDAPFLFNRAIDPDCLAAFMPLPGPGQDGELLRHRPPIPAITTCSPTSARLELPMGRTGMSS